MKDLERQIHQLAAKLAAGITRVFAAELERRKSLVKFAASAAREQEVARQLADLEEQPHATPAREADDRPVPDVQREDRRLVPVNEPAAPPAAPVAQVEDGGGESVDEEADELDDEPAPAPAKRDRFAAIQTAAAKRTGALPKPRTTVTF